MRGAWRPLPAIPINRDFIVATPTVTKLNAPRALVILPDAAPSIEIHDLARFLGKMHQLVADLSNNVIVDQAVDHRRTKAEPRRIPNPRLHRKAVFQGVSYPGVRRARHENGSNDGAGPPKGDQ
jgi:hypothetical protein